MNKTLRISFSLKNTYRVNGILFSLKQIPLLKRLLPATLYQIRGLKIFANILSVLWEIVSAFIGKFLYFFTMVCGVGLYKELPENEVFLHILLFLTVAGSYMNTVLFNPTKDKYYAMMLMRMDAREYTLVNYIYSILKVIMGFLPFTVLFGRDRGLPLWFCLLLPLCIAGMKLLVAAVSLWDYERRGCGYNENKLSKHLWGCTALLLGITYAPPAFGLVVPEFVSMTIFLACIPLGIAGLIKVITFQDYYAINKELLSGLTNQMDSTAVTQLVKQANEGKISTDASITSNRKGFEYLNELFIKRHKKILWKSTKRISYVSFFLVVAALVGIYLFPEQKSEINEVVMTLLPCFVFIMYGINRGTDFTQALFMNCDHSLLTYSFYKQPGMILSLFRIRLLEIMKINAVPALVIGGGLALILFATGGTDNPLNYVVLLVSILCMSLFFSIHYLTIYYLLQPYNAGTEVKSGTYRIVLAVTSFICYAFIFLRMPIMVFGILTILFCVLYSIIASILVYRLAPKTFRIRT
ncbi:MAG: hypothetical protein PUJ57_04445 [Peptoniphilaceae bacterium]|nr:hypothetical protein [Peptoniphilaceae bacterium]MDY6085367.1 hypothetical protein [Peptoniphilaceae bacterium]